MKREGGPREREREGGSKGEAKGGEGKEKGLQCLELKVGDEKEGGHEEEGGFN